MTLLELWRLIRRYWFVVVGLPILFFAILFGVSLNPSFTSYSATSAINVNAQFPFVSGLVSREIDLVQEDAPDVSIVSKPDSAKMTISITAKGPDAESVIECANAVTQAVAEKARSIYSDVAEGGYTLPFFAEIDEASDASKESILNRQYILVALLGGLFFSICFLALFNAIRRPIKDSNEVSDLTGLPNLGELPDTDHGKRLLANLIFSSHADMTNHQQWSFIPLKDAHDAQTVAEAIKQAASSENNSVEILTSDEMASKNADAQIAIVCCNALDQDISGVYCAQKSDVTAMIVHPWKDSLKEVEATIHELALARVEVTGFVVDNAR